MSGMFERRRLGLLDRQAKLRPQLDEPVQSPDDVASRLQAVLNFSASLPRAFREGDAVRRRQIFHAICANPIVRERKALYLAKEPWSFFSNSGRTRSWCAIVERMRTWVVEHDFQIPPIFAEIDPIEEKYRRTGTLARWARKNREKAIVPHRGEATWGEGVPPTSLRLRAKALLDHDPRSPLPNLPENS